MKTAGRWPWKLESDYECVTTHLPNQSARKMDCAGALCLTGVGPSFKMARVGSRADRGVEACARAHVDRIRSADLGSSSNYCSNFRHSTFFLAETLGKKLSDLKPTGLKWRRVPQQLHVAVGDSVLSDG